MGAEERGSFRIGMQDAAAGWGCGDGEEEGGHGAVLAKKPPPPPPCALPLPSGPLHGLSARPAHPAVGLKSRCASRLVRHVRHVRAALGRRDRVHERDLGWCKRW